MSVAAPSVRRGARTGRAQMAESWTKTPEMRGQIERRLLVTYRVDPEVAAGLLPPPYRPQLVAGSALAGMCMIRLGHLVLRGKPQWGGNHPEDAAHRIAMEWDEPTGTQTGVYIVRRDSNSLTNVLAGGCIYPGRHNRSRFVVAETPAEIRIFCRALDGSVEFDLHVRITETLEGSRLFRDVAEASAFFGQDATGDAGEGEGGEGGEGAAWTMRPATVLSARSSYFDDQKVFPRGSVEVDSALVMRPIEGRALPALRSDGVQSTV